MSRTITAMELKTLLASASPPVIIDVRRSSDYDADGTVIPGSTRRDPDHMESVDQALPREREIIVYCAHGRTLSNAAVDHLLARGFKARLVENGMDGWHEAGGDTLPAPR